jgi:ribose 5-phosphate isomerase B
MQQAQIVIGSDHAGFELKNIIIQYLRMKNYSVKDVGCYTDESVDYPDFAYKVAEDITAGNAERGILICGTGSGMCVAANRSLNIRAVNCLTVQMAELAIQHNNANVLCMGARLIDEQTAKDIVDAFLNATFEGGRHQRRVDKLSSAMLA